MGVVKSLAILDKETGEIVADEVLFIGKNPRYLDRGYVKVFTAFLSDVVESDKLAGKSIRLLFYMLQKLDWNSLTVFVVPSQARKDLGISKGTYHNWISDLIEFGVIERVNSYTYKLRPYSFVKGSHEKAVEQEMKVKES